MLSLSMAMTLFVTVVFWQRSAIRAVAHDVERQLLYSEDGMLTVGELRADPDLEELLYKVRVLGGLASLPDGSIERFGTVPEQSGRLTSLVSQAAVHGKLYSSLSGMTWGVVAPAKKYLNVAVPLVADQGAVGVIVSLDPLFAQLRSDLRFILVYLLVNLIVLTVLGLFRFISFTVRPVEDLVRLADSYEDDGLPFLSLGRKSEYSSLSGSLNQMLQRIEQDKQQLQHTIASLEAANNELITTRREVIQAEKLSSLGRMAGGLAHEIGNPIGIVQGYLGLLKDGLAEDDERGEFIQRSEQEMQRISILLRQLLDLSRPPTLTSGPISLHEVVEDLVSLLQPQPLMADVRTRCQFNADNDTVYASRDQLQQVLLNCLINAADAINSKESFSEGLIDISVYTIEDRGLQCIMVEIADNGIGVKQEELTSVFDPFYSTKEPGKGTGLGLSVSITLVESLGGTMGLAVNEKGGVTVTIALPLYKKGK